MGLSERLMGANLVSRIQFRPLNYPSEPPIIVLRLSRFFCLLPVEVDLGIIAVLRLAGVASGECAEEGVGQKTGYLLLRQSEGVVHPCLQQGNRLERERERERER